MSESPTPQHSDGSGRGKEPHSVADWELSPHRRPDVEFPTYQADKHRLASDPLVIEFDVPSSSRRAGPRFEPAFDLNDSNAGMGDAFIGIIVLAALGLLSLLLGGVRWLWQMAWSRSRRPKTTHLGTTTVTLTDEGLTVHSFDGTSHHVQWTLIDAVRAERTEDDVLQIVWRVAETGQRGTAEIGPGTDRGRLGHLLAKYAGSLYRSF